MRNIRDLSTLLYSETLKLAPEDNNRLFNLCGKLNEHIKLIEKRLGVLIRHRGHTFAVSGEECAVQTACVTLNNLYHETEKVSLLEAREIHMYLQTTAKAPSLASQDDHMD